MPVLSPTALAPLSRRPGVNRTNAYPLNGQRDLAAGLLSYETRGCTAPTPTLNPAPSPNLDVLVRAAIGKYVYVPDAQHVAAPPCKGQGAVPGFGTSYPALAADPPAGP
jgi:hypothetical protein